LDELLSLPSSAADLNLSPQRKREQLFKALLNHLEAKAQQSPVLMVFEDTQWIDPTSREVLDLCVDMVRHLPILLAITFRPEFQAVGWSLLRHEFDAQSARGTRPRGAGAQAGHQCVAHCRSRCGDR
jgi:predicted ATPase